MRFWKMMNEFRRALSKMVSAAAELEDATKEMEDKIIVLDSKIAQLDSRINDVKALEAEMKRTNDSNKVFKEFIRSVTMKEAIDVHM